MEGLSRVASAVIVLLAVYAVTAKAASELLPGTITRSDLTLQKVAEVDYHWLWKRITTAGLYVDEQRPRPGAGILDSDYPKAIVIDYGVGVSGERFCKMTRESLADAWPEAVLDRHAGAIDRLCDWYRSVESGDRYSLSWVPGSGLTLKWNDEVLGRIEHPEAARVILSLWLGRAAISEDQRDELLARWRKRD